MTVHQKQQRSLRLRREQSQASAQSTACGLEISPQPNPVFNMPSSARSRRKMSSSLATPSRLEEKVSKCRLLSLPLEIRNMIYCHLLVPAEKFKIAGPYVPWSMGPRSDRLRKEHFRKAHSALIGPYFYRNYGLCFEIFWTCKQIHDEALARYYEDNTFQYSNIECLFHHLATIGPRHRALIRRIDFPLWQRPKKKHIELLHECTALRSLCIVVDGCNGKLYGRDDRVLWRVDVLQKMRNIRGLKHLNVKFQEVPESNGYIVDEYFRKTPEKRCFDDAYLEEAAGELQELMRTPRSSPLRRMQRGWRPVQRSSARLAKMRQMKSELEAEGDGKRDGPNAIKSKSKSERR